MACFSWPAASASQAGWSQASKIMRTGLGWAEGTVGRFLHQKKTEKNAHHTVDKEEGKRATGLLNTFRLVGDLAVEEKREASRLLELIWAISKSLLTHPGGHGSCSTGGSSRRRPIRHTLLSSRLDHQMSPRGFLK